MRFVKFDSVLAGFELRVRRDGPRKGDDVVINVVVTDYFFTFHSFLFLGEERIPYSVRSN